VLEYVGYGELLLFLHEGCFVVLLIFGGDLFLVVGSICHIRLVLGPRSHWLVILAG
jgi:hypothetical protein